MATKKELTAQAELLGIDTSDLKTKSDLEEAIAEARGLEVDQDEVVRLKDDEGMSLKAISEQLDCSLRQVEVAYFSAAYEPITATSEDELAEAIKEAREDEGNSWMVIAARTGLTKGQVQALYAAAGGDVAGSNKTGRGVTKSETEEPKAKPAKKASKKATKAKGSKKAKAKSNGDLPDWDEAEEDDIRGALEGRTVTTAKGDVVVEKVLRIGRSKKGDRVVQVKDDDGNKANVTLSTITAVA